MRKFNLKGTVVERMKGIPREEPKIPDAAPVPKGTVPEMSAAFTDKQGVFAVAWRTDVGRLRKNNQDAVILGNGLAGVADGMGGHNGGEIASAGLRDGLLRETKGSKPDRETLREAVQTVNRELWEQQEKDFSLTGMGTTLTIAWPTEKEMIIGQVGDMVRRGVLTEEQAACHPMRNYITRAVGTEEDVELDITVHDRKQGDR